MAVESYHVLSEAGISDYKTLFDEVRQGTIRSNEKQGLSQSYQTYYKTLDEEDIKALGELYGFEIYVLQYPKTPFVDFAKS